MGLHLPGQDNVLVFSTGSITPASARYNIWAKSPLISPVYFLSLATVRNS